MMPTKLLSNREFPRSRHSKNHITAMDVRTYDVYLSICVKFGVRDTRYCRVRWKSEKGVLSCNEFTFTRVV